MKRNVRYCYSRREDPYTRIHLLVKKHKWERQSVGAIAALGCGLFSPLIGILLDTIVWLTPTTRLRFPLSKISIAFYILAFPLLAFGSHCLDLLEKKSSVLPPADSYSHEFDLGLKA